ncbi:large ribosomal subunit protein eL30-like [Hemiscyllium ocellatum]|uniref:large ribosomal subunit protein eL30-like n=1 Tax=Hemiscyllium ocellatum TaxID=170820 RepID=UPI00296710BD|nr:large ribosomal subunit protein eL30-like [Hemiscyllium ocellatum]
MVDAKKTKMSLESNDSRLQLVMKRGKYTLHYKQTLQMIHQGKARIPSSKVKVIHANYSPTLRKLEIEHYTILAKTGVHHHLGNNIKPGTACGKYSQVCTLAIIDPGDSDIIRITPDKSTRNKFSLFKKNNNSNNSYL